MLSVSAIVCTRGKRLRHFGINRFLDPQNKVAVSIISFEAIIVSQGS